MKVIKKTTKLRFVSMLLTLCMIFAMTPMTAQAAGNVSDKYWIDAAELGTFGMNGSKTVGKIKFGLKDSDDRLWAICGKDGSDLALLSTTGFATGIYGLTSEYSKSNFVTDLKKTNSTYLGTDYFSSEELNKMQPVTVETEEPDTINNSNHTVTVENLKLYLPNSKSPKSFDETIIYVGKNNNIPVDLKTHMIPSQGFQKILFWLRSPNLAEIDYAHVAYPDIDVNKRYVKIKNSHYVTVMPALNLDLSSVLFASAADEATSDKVIENSSMEENTYTLRYQSNGSESAEISVNGKQVNIKDAENKYLVVQDSDGVYIKKIATNDETIINATEINTASGTPLTDFKNCKVWIESTTDRITTAKMATQATADVEIINPTDSHITTGNGATTQTGLTDAMTPVVYTAESGYYFPTDYTVAENNGITVTRNSYTKITVSGTPTANASITLAPATKKVTPKAPDVKGGEEKILGTTTEMEYASSETATNWKACSPENTTLTAGTWYVRYAATDTQNAGKTATVQVRPKVQPSGSVQTDSPQTGDNSNMLLWIALMFVSFSGIVTIGVVRKKKVRSK